MGRVNHHRDLPEARVVRPGGRRQWRPTISFAERFEQSTEALRPHVHAVLTYLIGLWPLVVVTLMAAAMIWGAGYQEPHLP